MISSQPPAQPKRKLPVDAPNENGQGPRAQTKKMMIMMNPHVNGKGPQPCNGINQVVRKLVSALFNPFIQHVQHVPTRQRTVPVRPVKEIIEDSLREDIKASNVCVH